MPCIQDLLTRKNRQLENRIDECKNSQVFKFDSLKGIKTISRLPLTRMEECYLLAAQSVGYAETIVMTVTKSTLIPFQHSVARIFVSPTKT